MEKEIRQAKNRPAEFVVQQDGFACHFGIILWKYRICKISINPVSRAILMGKKDCIHAGFRRFRNYSHSTNPNQFCLEIILCRIRGAFDYLIYPYYPAYMG